MRWRGASQRGRCDIAAHPPLREAVHARLRRGWSPEEIAGTLKLDCPERTPMHTCLESICRYVYIVAVGEIRCELAKCLRRSHRIRKPRRRGAAAIQGKIADMVLVDQRPAEVETRLIAGHYEVDLILVEGNRSAVGVLVERTTRYTMLCHLKQKPPPACARLLPAGSPTFPQCFASASLAIKARRCPGSTRRSPPTPD